MVNKTKKRRFFQVALLVLIIVLQCLVLLFWYLETKSDEKIQTITNETAHLDKARLYSDQSKALLIKSQILYRDYLYNNNQNSLDDYFKTLTDINNSVGDLNTELHQNFQIKDSLKLDKLRKDLEQIINQTSYLDRNSIDDLMAKKFDYKEILNSVTFDSIVTRDSIAKKGFFSRMIDAISGKYSIQKEKIEIIASYKYQNKVNSGELKSQIENILKDSDAHYKKQINAVKESFGASNGVKSELHSINDDLLNSTSDLISKYNEIIQPLKKESNNQFKITTETKRKQRNYLVFGLTVLMLVFSFLLFRFMLYAFDLEKQLIASNLQIQKNLDYKSKIIGMISHEVRSPLSVISLYCKMIVNKIQDSEIKEVFGSIQNTSSNLLLMTNQILDYSKNENVKMELNATDFLLHDELAKSMEPLQKLSIESGNQFQWKSNVPKDLSVHSDAVKINQLFYNLVGNALKFTKNGTISIETTTKKLSDNVYHFHATVTDTGVGIAKKDLEHIFEDYYQGSNGMTSMGIGLGLKLCKEIIELFDGEINVQSEVGKGTSVSFVLKLEVNGE